MEREEKEKHVCQCKICRKDRLSVTAEWHRALNEAVYQADEKQARLVAGLEALRAGWGGITKISEITGLDRKTIGRGLREVREGGPTEGRIREPGAGRKKVEKKKTRSSCPC